MLSRAKIYVSLQDCRSALERLECYGRGVGDGVHIVVVVDTNDEDGFRSREEIFTALNRGRRGGRTKETSFICFRLALRTTWLASRLKSTISYAGFLSNWRRRVSYCRSFALVTALFCQVAR